MPISNEFICPKGHKFTAIAKLRARCPNCGQMARRDFQKVEKEKSNISVTPTKNSGVRQHSTSLSNTSDGEEYNKRLVRGSKRVLTSKAEKKPSSETKSIPDTKKSTRLPKAVVVKQGPPRKLVSSMPKRTIVPATPKRSSTIVQHRRARTGSSPIVKRKPIGSHERKVVEQVQGSDPFWVQAKKKYFR